MSVVRSILGANYEAADDSLHLARSVSYVRGLRGMAHVE